MNRFAFFVLAALLLGACAPYSGSRQPGAYYPQEQAQLQSRQLRVQAEAQVEAVPDLVRMRLGVVTAAKDAGQAVRENNERMHTIMSELLELGLHQDDLASGQFQISPQWSQPPRPTPANWQREIVGYRVSNDLWVTTTQVDLAGDLLGAGHSSGANHVDNLQFSIADTDSYQQQAMALATQKAVRQARILADAAGARLGEIVSLSLDQDGSSFSPPMLAEARMMSAADAVPVTPGKVKIEAAVTLVFALENSPTATE